LIYLQLKSAHGDEDILSKTKSPKPKRANLQQKILVSEKLGRKQYFDFFVFSAFKKI